MVNSLKIEWTYEGSVTVIYGNGRKDEYLFSPSAVVGMVNAIEETVLALGFKVESVLVK